MKKKIAIITTVALAHLCCIGGLLYLTIDHGVYYSNFLRQRARSFDVEFWYAAFRKTFYAEAAIFYISLGCLIVFTATAIFVFCLLVKNIKKGGRQ